MKRYIIIPKNEFTDEMKSKLSRYWDSIDSSSVMGLLTSSNLDSIFLNYPLLNITEYFEELNNNPEKWVPEEIR